MNYKHLILVVMLISTSCLAFPRQSVIKTAHNEQSHTRQGIQKIILGMVCCVVLVSYPAYWGFEGCKAQWHKSVVGGALLLEGKTDFNLPHMLRDFLYTLTPLIPLYFIYDGCCEAHIITPEDGYVTRIKRFIKRIKESNEKRAAHEGDIHRVGTP